MLAAFSVGFQADSRAVVAQNDAFGSAGEITALRDPR